MEPGTYGAPFRRVARVELLSAGSLALVEDTWSVGDDLEGGPVSIRHWEERDGEAVETRTLPRLEKTEEFIGDLLLGALTERALAAGAPKDTMRAVVQRVREATPEPDVSLREVDPTIEEGLSLTVDGLTARAAAGETTTIGVLHAATTSAPRLTLAD